MSYFYTYELGIIACLEADSAETAAIRIEKVIDDLLANEGTMEVISHLCHIMSEDSQTVFASDNEFVPFPRSK